ncbi:MAG: NAD(P)H-quinone oxidoreductase [Longimicrobiales bacterium]
MKAVFITAPGGPEVLELREVDIPALGPGQIRVQVHATALNRADLLQRRGQYPAPPGAPPNIPGLEYAGIVDEVAADAQRWRVGDRVMGLVGGGAYAQYVVVHQDEALPVPAHWLLEEAAAVPEAFLTAHDALFTLMQLKENQTVLIHAVASGVGTAALQLASVLGARVIGTTRTKEKIEGLRALGIDHVVDVTHSDWIEEVDRLTKGAGVHGILDLVGGDYLPGNIRSLTPRGRLIVVGLTAGSTAPLDLRAVLRKRLTIIGTVMRTRTLEEKIAATQAFERTALSWLEAGIVRPVIDRVLTINKVAEAHRALEANETVGKIVLIWP